MTKHATHLEGERRDRVVHDLGQAEGQHQDDQQFAVHGAQRHPQVGAANQSQATKKKKRRASHRWPIPARPDRRPTPLWVNDADRHARR